VSLGNIALAFALDKVVDPVPKEWALNLDSGHRFGIMGATMVDDSRSRFDAGSETWAGYYRKPLGRIRHQVTWCNLAPHLPDITEAGDPPRVLDAGGGSGEMAIQLARHGYRVWLLDYAPAMLSQARQAAQSLPRTIHDRLCFCEMAIDDAPDAFAASFFDVITCHTLIEYLPEPYDTLRTLVGLLRGGGLLSLSFVNRHAEVMRQLWQQSNPEEALTRLEQGGAFGASLFGVSGVAYDAEEVTAWLAELGLTVAATCGVRAFADYVPRERLNNAKYYEAMLRLELAAATRSPYRLIARYVQLLACRSVEPVGRI
jgi:S-adenosylmethionine-dependent methyltransferase